MDIEFIKTNLEDPWIDQFNSIYQNYNVYRTIIIVDDDSTLETIQMYLEKDSHSYDIVSSNNYAMEFDRFLKSCKRILLLSYEDYMLGFYAIINNLQNQHNLLILENLEPFEEKKILEIIGKANMDGLLKSDYPYYIWVN